MLTALTTITTACCTRLGVGRRSPVEELELTALPAWRALGLCDGDEDSVLAVASEVVESGRELVAS